MSSLVSLFLCMTLIYFSYSAISYKVMVVHVIDMFLSSSFVYHLEARVRHEHYPSIHLKDDILIHFVFVHKLEARVLHEHNPLILLIRHKRVRTRSYD
jgi:hypothetical protein